MKRLYFRIFLFIFILVSITKDFFHKIFAGKKPSFDKVIICQSLLLGDSLMLDPLLARVKREYSKSQIYLMVSEASLDLFQCNPYGIQCIVYNPRKLSSLFKLWRLRGFDIAYIPAENRLSLLAKALQTTQIIGYEGDHPNYKNHFLTTAIKFPSMPQALPDLFQGLVKVNKNQLPEDSLSSDLKDITTSWHIPKDKNPLKNNTQKYVVMHVGASSRLKYWQPTKWFKLASYFDSLGYQVVWTAGFGEKKLVKEIDPSDQFINMAGCCTLLEMTALIADATLLISPDTGIAHLGKLLRIPTVTLFGPGSEFLCGVGQSWQNRPYIGVVKEIPCRNQKKLFRREINWVQRCGRLAGTSGKETGQCDAADCMIAITTEEVISACDRLIKQHA